LQNHCFIACIIAVAALQQKLCCGASSALISGSAVPAKNKAMKPGKGLNTMFLSIIRYLHSWKRYGQAVQELTNLSDRELADIGITRSDIPRLAWEHAHH
jgi:uncharacterized protein YjiS (DUF1127 family)